MPPALRGFPRAVVERVFIEFAVHLLEDFGDGQTRWGNQPMTKPFKGRSIMVQRTPGFGTTDDCYDVFTIGAIIERLGLGSKKEEIRARIEKVALEESEKE